MKTFYEYIAQAPPMQQNPPAQSAAEILRQRQQKRAAEQGNVPTQQTQDAKAAAERLQQRMQQRQGGGSTPTQNQSDSSKELTYNDEKLGYYIQEMKRLIHFDLIYSTDKDGNKTLEKGPDGKPLGEMKFKNKDNMRFEDYNHYTKDIYVIRKDGVYISGKDFLSIIDKLEKGLNVKFDDRSPVGMKMYTDMVMDRLLCLVDYKNLKPIEVNKMKRYVNNIFYSEYHDQWKKEFENAGK
jgi:hypothetical protein